MVDDSPLALGPGGQQHLLDDLGQRGGRRLHCTRKRVAAEGTKTYRPHLRLFPVGEPEAIVIDHDEGPIAFHNRPYLGPVEGHDVDAFQVDVLPDVQLGPVANRKHSDALTPVDPAVVEVPELRSLVLRIPSVVPVPKTEHPLLGPGPFLVAPGASERGIEATGVQRLA